MDAQVDTIYTREDQSLVLELGSARFEIQAWYRDADSDKLLDGWHVFRHGDLDGMYCSEDGVSEDGNSAIHAVLEQSGFFMPHDANEIFKNLYKALVLSSSDQSNWSESSDRLTKLIKETTEAHQRFEQS